MHFKISPIFVRLGVTVISLFVCIPGPNLMGGSTLLCTFSSPNTFDFEGACEIAEVNDFTDCAEFAMSSFCRADESAYSFPFFLSIDSESLLLLSNGNNKGADASQLEIEFACLMEGSILSLSHCCSGMHASPAVGTYERVKSLGMCDRCFQTCVFTKVEEKVRGKKSNEQDVTEGREALVEISSRDSKVGITVPSIFLARFLSEKVDFKSVSVHSLY